MKIRLANKKDADKFRILAKKADNYPSYWSKSRFPNFLNNPTQIILLAEDKGKLLGFVGLQKQCLDKRVINRMPKINDLTYITWIAVLPESRKKHIGFKLMKECERYTKKFKQKGIWLTCKKEVIGFYNKLNYKVYGYFIKESDGKRFRKFFMSKELK